MKKWFAIGALALIMFFVFYYGSTQAAPDANAAARVAVIFSGGHETDARDNGRPVVLIAAALGVPENVFRDAFSRVRPAHGRAPTDAEARANKKALMDALAPYGVTDQRLNEVSDYYRYRREEGELWPMKSAIAVALMKNGKIIGFEIEDGGSGYSSPPRVSIPGFEKTALVANISWNENLQTNGAIVSVLFSRTEKLAGDKK